MVKNGKNVVKKMSKNLSSQYSQKLLDHAKQSATDALKTASKRAIQIAWVIADKITSISRTSLEYNSETNEEEILKERYTSPEQR